MTQNAIAWQKEWQDGGGKITPCRQVLLIADLAEALEDLRPAEAGYPKYIYGDGEHTLVAESLDEAPLDIFLSAQRDFLMPMRDLCPICMKQGRTLEEALSCTSDHK